MRHSDKRDTEMAQIPLAEFRQSVEGRQLADVYTHLKDVTAPLRFLVLRDDQTSESKYVGFITNDEITEGVVLLSYYRGRWRIENWFRDNDFIGINQLVSMELNAVVVNMSLKLMAYNVLSAFRNNLGEPFNCYSPELIYRHFIKNIQGKLVLRDGVIQITVYGFKHQSLIKKLFTNLNEQLERQNIDPRIPWLNKHRVAFKFA